MKSAAIIDGLVKKLAKARAENRQLAAQIRDMRGVRTRQHQALLVHLKAETERADRAEAQVREFRDQGMKALSAYAAEMEAMKGHMRRLGLLPGQSLHA